MLVLKATALRQDRPSHHSDEKTSARACRRRLPLILQLRMVGPVEGTVTTATRTSLSQSWCCLRAAKTQNRARFFMTKNPSLEFAQWDKWCREGNCATFYRLALVIMTPMRQEVKRALLSPNTRDQPKRHHAALTRVLMKPMTPVISVATVTRPPLPLVMR